MTPKSVSRDRLIAWLAACQDYGYVTAPPPTSLLLSDPIEGAVAFRAIKTVQTPYGEIECSLRVAEQWAEGEDPEGDRRLESAGCHLLTATWHLQVGTESGAEGAERLDVLPVANETHPRIHRHPLGWANHIRLASELPPPQSWLPTAEALAELFIASHNQEDVQD